MRRSPWIILLGSKSKLTNFFLRVTWKRDTERRQDGHLKMEAGGCRQSPEAARGKDWFFPLESGESMASTAVQVSVFTFQNCKRIHSVLSLQFDRAGHSELGNRRLTRNTAAASKINFLMSLHMLHPLFRLFFPALLFGYLLPSLFICAASDCFLDQPYQKVSIILIFPKECFCIVVFKSIFK